MTFRTEKRAFTLIELVVVLAVLAIVAHLAVREMSHFANSERHEAADRQLRSFAEAVLSDDCESGFLADMGRLPRAVPMNESEETLSLAELVRGSCEFRVRHATGDTLLGDAVADANVVIPCGWRGPYVNAPLWKNPRIADPWGNPLEGRDSAGYCRLLGVDSNDIATAGAEIGYVRHFGSDGQPDDRHAPGNDEARDLTVCLLPTGGTSSSLTVSRDFIVNKMKLEEAGDLMKPLSLRWYGAYEASITGGVEKIEVGADFITLEKLVPGRKYIKVVDEESGKTSILVKLVLRPGANAF